jgi:hypothetical protein
MSRKNSRPQTKSPLREIEETVAKQAATVKRLESLGLVCEAAIGRELLKTFQEMLELARGDVSPPSAA